MTGATGFVGQRYVKHLCSRHELTVFCCGRNATIGEQLKKTGAHFYRGDLLDENFVNHICRGMDVVVHCAGKTGVWGDYQAFHQGNVVTTDNVIAACKQNNVSRLVNLSTPSIYFDYRDHLNITEDYLPSRFSDNYARTKYQAERRVSAAHCDQFCTVSLRPRLIIGVGDQSFFPRLIHMHQRSKLKRIGPGRNVVSVTSIENLLHAMDLCVLGKEEALGGVYNISNPLPVNFWGMVDDLFDAIDMPKLTHMVPYPLAYGAGWVSERVAILLRRNQEPDIMPLKVSITSRSMTLSIDKARQKLGYRPVMTVEDSIVKYAENWKQQVVKQQEAEKQQATLET